MTNTTTALTTPTRLSPGPLGGVFAKPGIADDVVSEPFGGGRGVELAASSGYLFEERGIQGVATHLLQELLRCPDVASESPLLDEPRNADLVEPRVAGDERGTTDDDGLVDRGRPRLADEDVARGEISSHVLDIAFDPEQILPHPERPELLFQSLVPARYDYDLQRDIRVEQRPNQRQLVPPHPLAPGRHQAGEAVFEPEARTSLGLGGRVEESLADGVAEAYVRQVALGHSEANEVAPRLLRGNDDVVGMRVGPVRAYADQLVGEAEHGHFEAADTLGFCQTRGHETVVGEDEPRGITSQIICCGAG